MANVKISELNETFSVANVDVFPIVKTVANTTDKVSGSTLRTYFNADVMGGNLTTNLLGNGFSAQNLNTVTVVNGLTAGNIAANTTISAGGNVTGLNLRTTGEVVATGDITGTNLIAGGRVEATGNVTGANINTAGVVRATGAITSNATVTATGNVSGGNLTTAGQLVATGNATVGNLNTAGRISATGNISGNNVNAAGQITAVGNITAPYFIGNIVGAIDAAGNINEVQFHGNGDLLTASANFTFNPATNLMTVAGNIAGGNLTTGGQVTATGNATAGNFTTAGQVTATQTITGGNLITGGVVTANGNITGANFTTAGQATVTGNVAGGNINTTGVVAATGNVTGANLNTSGIVNAAGNINGASVNANGVVSATGNISGANFTTAGLVSATGNVSGGNLTTAGRVDATGNLTAGNISTGGTVNASGNITAPYFIGNIVGAIDAAGNINEVQFHGAGDLLAASPNFTFDSANSILNVSGNVVGNNLQTSGVVSATGNITGGNLNTIGRVSATGNVSGGNITTGGVVDATGNVNGQNVNALETVSANNISATNSITATGNISANNVLATTDVVATGNIDGNNVNTDNVFATADLTLTASAGNIVLNPTGNIDASGTYINNVSTPVQGSDAATKQYVDDAISSGIHIHTPVLLESNVALNGTYAQGGNVFTVISTVAGNTVVFSTAANLQVNDQLWFANGFEGLLGNTPYFVVNTPNTSAAVLSAAYGGTPVTTITSNTGLTQSVRVNSGVGATLTNAGANATLVVDGVSTATNNRILLRNQSNTFENGTYVVSDAGNATARWVLTRSADADTYIPDTSDGLDQGSYFFVQSGSTGAGSSYVLTQPPGPFIIGLANLTFTQFTASQVYSANSQAGIDLTGTVFSAKVDNITTGFDGGGNIIVKANAVFTTPNIDSATGTSLNLSGNLSAGNISTAGEITANGNITGNYILGDGSQLTNLPAGTQILNGTSNVDIATANGNVSVAVAGASDVVVVSATDIVANANLLPQANVTYDLGSNTQRWKDVWLSNSTLYLGETAVSANANGLVVNNEIVVTADANNLLDVSSIVVAGNVTANGNVQGNFILGDGSQLTNLPVQPGTYSNANVANYLPTYSGNLESLTGNVTTTGNIQGNFIIGDGSQLTNLPTLDNYSNANVANYLPTYSGNLANLQGNVITTANVQANFFLGDGSQLTNLPVQPGTYSNANVANYLPTYSGNLESLTGNVVTTANIQGNFILGNGAFLTGLPATYSNADVANYLPTYSGNLVSLTGDVVTTANVQANFFIGNGSQLTGIAANYSNANVANYLPTYSGNLVSLTGNVTTTANINANNLQVTSNVLVANLNANLLQGRTLASARTPSTVVARDSSGSFAANVVTANNFTANQTLISQGNADITGNVTAGNISTTGTITATGNIQGNFILGDGSQLTNLPLGNYSNANVANYLPTYSGNLANLQGNVTTTGNIQGNFILGDGSQLTNLPLGNYSNANVANYLPTYTGNLESLTGNVTTTANIQANFFIGNGSQLTGIVANYSNSNVEAYLPTYTGNLVSLTGNVITTGNLSAGNIATRQVSANNGVTITGGILNMNNRAIANADQISISDPGRGEGLNFNGGNLWSIFESPNDFTNSGGNLQFTSGNTANVSNTAAYTRVTFNTLGQIDIPETDFAPLVVASNVLVANLNANLLQGFTTATAATPNTIALRDSNGNLTANFFIGNGSQLTGIVANYSNANVANYLPTYTGNLVSLTGNVTTTANVQANYFIGNGSQLTGIVANYSNANVANYLPTYTGNLVSLTGDVITTGNITGNVLTGNSITTSGGNGNITGVNYITANYFVGDGSLLTNVAGGSYSNANVANYLPTYTGNLVSLTGNIITTANITANNIAANGITTTGGNGNISGVNYITANFFVGDGSLLSNINAANITGGYSNANVANYLPTYTGNLVSLTGNVTTTANITANGFTAANGINVVSGVLNMGGRNITAVNALAIADPGPGEGISWTGGNSWQIFESPDGFTNTGGNLQFTSGNISNVSNTAAYTRISFTTTGQITVPATAVAPFNVASNVLVANLNANLLQGFTVATAATANTIALRDSNGNLTANFFIGDGSQLTNVSANANLVTYSGNIGGLANAFSVTIGSNARSNSTSANAIAIGTRAGNNTQGANAIALGLTAGLSAQGISAIAIGVNAGADTQDDQAIAIGVDAGSITQSANAVAIGTNAGYTLQANRATAIGPESGYQNQGTNAAAIGAFAGYSDQGNNSVAIGYGAAYLAQDTLAVAIGANTAFNNQGTYSICIGAESGNNQGNYAVALGGSTGNNQGEYAIAIGYNAGDGADPQADYSIVLNATGANLTSNVANTFTVKPVRNGGNTGSLPSGFVNMAYNPTTGEIIYWT